MNIFKTIIILIIKSLKKVYGNQLYPRDIIDKYKNSNFVNTFSSFNYSPSVKYCKNFEENIKWLSEKKSLYIYILDQIPDSYKRDFFFWKDKNTELYLKQLLDILIDEYNLSKDDYLIFLISLKDKNINYIRGRKLKFNLNVKYEDRLYANVYPYFQNESDYEKGICYFFNLIYEKAHSSDVFLILFFYFILWILIFIGVIAWSYMKKIKNNNNQNNHIQMNLLN